MNGDDRIDLADAADLLAFLFVDAAPAPSCRETADINDNGILGLPDGIRLLNFLFIPGSPAPAPPFPACGEDNPGLDVGCDHYPGCSS